MIQQIVEVKDESLYDLFNIETINIYISKLFYKYLNNLGISLKKKEKEKKVLV